MPKVIVGMSGGVDSAVAAYLLKQQGYDVMGLTLRTWESSSGDEGRCCEIDAARQTAGIIGIPYHAVNCLSAFTKSVVEPFIEDYAHGMTPNPCVVCNRYVKWEKMLYFAKVFGADYIATGHYASVVKLENGRYTVQTARHSEKDQTYMLYALTQEQLAATLMPLGDLSKAEVRQIARDSGIPVADKPDSQEVCFVTDGNYADFVAENYSGDLPGEGDFVDTRGNVLGRHRGIINYTVGQRKGLGVALGRPAYVQKIDVQKNEVVLTGEDGLYCGGVICKGVNYMSVDPLGEGEALRCRVKVRYRHPGQASRIEAAGGVVKVTFDAPVKAATPGQSAVFYDDLGRIIGGGVIAGTF